MEKRHARSEEKLRLSKKGRIALLKALIPLLRMRPEPDSEAEIAGHLFSRITGYTDFAAWLEQNRGKPMKESIRIDPLEKAFLLKTIHDGLGAVGTDDDFRKGLESVLAELRTGKHPLSGHRNAGP